MNAPPSKAPFRFPVDPVLLLLLLLGLAVRALFWLQAWDQTFYQLPSGDAATYLFQTQQLEMFGLGAPAGQPYNMAPLYPFFLLFLKTLGFTPFVVRLLQSLFGVVGVALLWTLGKRLAGRKGAIVAGLGAALYGPFLFYEADLLSIALAIFLFEIALVLWGRSRAAFWVGLLLGLMALAQPNFLIVGMVGVGASLLWPERMGWSSRRLAWILAIGLALPPLATLTRNLAVSGEPVLIATNGGVNFYIGNNPSADGTFELPPESGLLNDPTGLFTSARAVAEEDAGHPLTNVQVDRYWWLRGLDFWLTEPNRALGVTLVKVLACLTDREIPSHYDYEFIQERVDVLKLLPTMGWLLPLGGVGLALSWRRRKRLGVVLFLAVLVSVVPFFVTGRYRLPLAVLLLPAAGLAVERAWAARRIPRELVYLGGAAALYLVLAFFPLYSSGANRVHMLNVEGATLLANGRFDEAQKVLEQALALDPTHPEVLNNLAFVLQQEGQVDRALELYRRALASNPMQAETYLNLEELYRQKRQPREALEMLDRLEKARGGNIQDVAAKVAYRRGVNTLSLRDTTAARGYLEQAVTIDPQLAGAWISLSILYRLMGLPEKALDAATHAVALSPGAPEAQVSYAKALEEMGKTKEAIAAYSNVVQLGVQDADLYYRLGRLFAETGNDADAERFFVAANQGKPHVPSLWALAALYERTGQNDKAMTAYKALVRADPSRAKEARERLQALRGATGGGG